MIILMVVLALIALTVGIEYGVALLQDLMAYSTLGGWLAFALIVIASLLFVRYCDH